MTAVNAKFSRLYLFVATISVIGFGGAIGAGPAVALTPANVPCGLVSWWPLDGNAIDIKSAHNGAVSGGNFVAAMVNKGWNVGGQTSVIVVPDAPAFHVTKFSVDFWIKLTSLNQLNSAVIWKGNSLGQNKTSPFFVGIRGSNTVNNLPGVPGMVIVGLGNQTSFQLLQSSVALPLNTFKHITVTAGGSGAELKLYIDGVLNNQTTQTVIPVSASHPLQIGGVANSGSNNNSLNGVIDEVEFFNRVLDPTPKSEITAIFQAGSLGKCKT